LNIDVIRCRLLPAAWPMALMMVMASPAKA
jgi:hypothetical protein